MNEAIRDRQLVVKLTNCSPEWPFLRQTPGRKGIWGNLRFVVDDDLDRCDFWVVYDGLPKAETVRCPRGNTLLLTSEPPSVKRYDPAFLKQFAHVVTSHRTIDHPSCIYHQQALIWLVGASYDQTRNRWSEQFTKDYDELSQMSRPMKDRLISVIASDKAITPGHKLRLDFIAKMKDRFGEAIDVFGVGGKKIPDKWDGIAPYKYHLVLENSWYADYWSEKLADAFLGWAYPLYYGCPNIHDYFPQGALQEIDIGEPDKAVAVIEKTIKENRCDLQASRLDAARDLVLNRYSLFPLLEQLITKHLRSGEDVVTALCPEKKSPVLAKIRRFRNWMVGEGVRRSY